MLTFFRKHSEGDAVASLLDQLHYVVVRQLHDALAVDGGDAVTHFKLSGTIRRTSLNDPSNLMRNYCRFKTTTNEFCFMRRNLYKPSRHVQLFIHIKIYKKNLIFTILGLV